VLTTLPTNDNASLQ